MAAKGITNNRRRRESIANVNNANPLFLKHSSILDVDGVKVNTLYIEHHKAKQLPERLPTLYFVHGLGGSMEQFEPIIDYCSHFASVIAIDLPGHGKSPLHYGWESYTQSSLIQLLYKVAEKLEPQYSTPDLVMIGHSLGAILAAKFALTFSEVTRGVVDICPPAKMDPALAAIQARLRYFPEWLFNMFRWYSGRGGTESESVRRFVSPSSPLSVREKQLEWNSAVNTSSWLRLAHYFTLVSDEQWVELDKSVPVLFIEALDDQVCPVKDMQELKDRLLPHAEFMVISDAGHAVMAEKPQVVCGLIGTFLSERVNEKLSLPWQLAYWASLDNKWSLKNEAKWRKVQNVGAPVAGSCLRGMKTLRQNDPEHSPVTLEAAHPEIKHIIDISREEPVYDPSTFKHIIYHKFPTVSKVPPSSEQVENFIKLVNDCIEETKGGCGPGSIAVHCHYGFNRTGFLIASYLIEEKGMCVKDAVEAWAVARPPGMKHVHFVDELYVRYEQ